MSVYSASLGVECSHCHEAGNCAATTKPAHAMVEKMMPIFDEIPKHFDKSRPPRSATGDSTRSGRRSDNRRRDYVRSAFSWARSVAILT